MTLTKEKKTEVIKQYSVHTMDTGSDEVQVAVLTEKINELTEHLKVHKKDFSSRRGLLMMVGKRASLLKHLEKSSKQKYLTLIKKLGIRK